MLANFAATTNIRGGRVDLEWSWIDAQNFWPALRLVRRRRRYPIAEDDGLSLVDLPALFAVDAEASRVVWDEIGRIRFVMTNTSHEGGLDALRLDWHRGALPGADSLTATVTSWTGTAFLPGVGNALRLEVGTPYFTVNDLGSMPFEPPIDIAVEWSDGAGGEPCVVHITSVTRIVRGVASPPPPWDNAVLWQIFIATPAGEQLAANLTRHYGGPPGTPEEVIYRAIGEGPHAVTALSAPGAWETIRAWPVSAVYPDSSRSWVGTASSIQRQTGEQLASWIPAQGGGVNSRWASIQRAVTEITTPAAGASPGQGGNRLHSVLQTFVDGGTSPQLVIELDDAFDADKRQWMRSVRVQDRMPAAIGDPELAPGHYYYRLFDGQDPDFDAQAARLQAFASGRYGFASDPLRPSAEQHQLYRMLPAAHQTLDEPDPSDFGTGQLRAFLESFGLSLDHIRSSADGLLTRHDVAETPAAHLPFIAQWLAWNLDVADDEIAQRLALSLAPGVYESVGTFASLNAIVNRTTGWPVRYKEYGHNVILTNEPEPIHFWDLWCERRSATHVSTVPYTQTDGFDGRPVLFVAGIELLYAIWHTNGRIPDDGPRKIVGRRFESAEPPKALVGTTEPHQDPALVAHSGDTWLAYALHTNDRWDVYAHPIVFGTDSPHEPTPEDAVSQSSAEDRWPTLVSYATGNEQQLWVFWQSNRRGPFDIWFRRRTSTGWSETLPVTCAPHHDEMPAAIVHQGTVWLFWSRDEGDRRTLWVKKSSTRGELSVDTLEQRLPFSGGLYRDEAPVPVFWNQQLNLLWHSNRGTPRRFRIYMSTLLPGGWTDPVIVAESHSGDREPAAAANGNELALLWRSQRRGEVQRSRTVDTRDLQRLADMGTFDDTLHYTHDSGLTNDDWYARGALGVRLDVPEQETQLVDKLHYLQGVAAPFRPAPVRFVWQRGLRNTTEALASDRGMIDGWKDGQQ